MGFLEKIPFIFCSGVGGAGARPILHSFFIFFIPLQKILMALTFLSVTFIRVLRFLDTTNACKNTILKPDLGNICILIYRVHHHKLYFLKFCLLFNTSILPYSIGGWGISKITIIFFEIISISAHFAISKLLDPERIFCERDL